MVRKPVRFNPELLLSAGRRSAGQPNHDGSKILYTISRYSFSEHKKTTLIGILDAEDSESSAEFEVEGSGSPQWIGDKLLIPAASTYTKGGTDLWVGEASLNWQETKYLAGTVDGAADSIKLRPIGEDKDHYIIALSALAKPDGTIFNEAKQAEEKRHTSGKVYSSMFVRHWDTWITSNRQSIFYGTLKSEDGKWKLSSLKNALKGLALESPVPPFGGADHYDISPHGLVFVAKDPKLNPATNTKSNVYLATMADFDGSQNLPAPFEVKISGYEGASTSPSFSRDGLKLAFLRMRQNGYEADRNEIFTIPDVRRPAFINHFVGFPEQKKLWDVSPSSVQWAQDGRSVLLEAEQHGRNVLWKLSTEYEHLTSIPTKIFEVGSVSSFAQLPHDGLLVSTTSLVDNSAFWRVKRVDDGVFTKYTKHLLSSHSQGGAHWGLSQSQVEDIWFQGAESKVHAWVIKPSNFDKSKKYPLAYLIHGGPQGAWLDSWSTRWNPLVFAEQGYVVVTPNPTGSTGYGQAFCDAIGNQWGGLPYIDIARGFDYIEENLDYVDTSKAVALGASYGGYMMNWIQGQPLGRKLKAIVCHDGVFSMAGQMASEELYFPEREFGGKFWEVPSSWARWDPSRFTHNWATPQLVIHSEKDYRLTLSEGLAAFHTLQDRGVESQFLTFPDENHWVLGQENSLLWHTVVLDFVNRHVGLTPYSEQSKLAKELLEQASIVEPVADERVR